MQFTNTAWRRDTDRYTAFQKKFHSFYTRVISGFRRAVNETFVLLGFYAQNGKLQLMFRNIASVPSSRVKPLTLGDGTDKSFRNVSIKLPFYAA